MVYHFIDREQEQFMDGPTQDLSMKQFCNVVCALAL